MRKAMGMIRCEDALAWLWEFLDGELPPDEDAAVKKHLEFCNRCYPQYDFQRAYFEYTRQVRDRERAPAELRQRLFRTLLEREAVNGETR
jgi:mycothiol system anti-sigma-R factor